VGEEPQKAYEKADEKALLQPSGWAGWSQIIKDS
jgi:hypothetical protein